MNQEQFKEVAEHLAKKLTDHEIVSAFIGVLYGICNEDVQEVKELINYFEEEANKIKQS